MEASEPRRRTLEEEDGEEEKEAARPTVHAVALSGSGSPLSAVISSLPLLPLCVSFIYLFYFRAPVCDSDGGDVLTRLPPGRFPGSLTIFL